MAQTRQQIIELLEAIGRSPDRRLGQHFMIEPALIERLAAEAGLGDHPIILEVGPGTGALTEVLLEAGGEVLAVEIDRHLADLLDSRLGGPFAGRFHLICADVLESKHRLNRQMVTALADMSDKPGGRPVRLVANLPYNIASPLVAELIGLSWQAWHRSAQQPGPASGGQAGGLLVDRLVFTVQREVAERLTASPDTKEYGPLSVLCQGLGLIQTLVGRISPNAFYPKPNVFSAMLRIDLPADRLARVADLEALKAWLEAGFGHRRKTLAASIRLAEPPWRDRLAAAAASTGLDTGRRGETLTVDEFLALAERT